MHIYIHHIRSPVRDHNFDRNRGGTDHFDQGLNPKGAVSTTSSRIRVQAPYVGWGDSQGRTPQKGRYGSPSRSRSPTPNRDPRKANNRYNQYKDTGVGMYSTQRADLKFSSGSGNDSYGHQIQRPKSMSPPRQLPRPSRDAGNAYSPANPTFNTRTTRSSTLTPKGDYSKHTTRDTTFDSTNSLYSGLDVAASDQDYTKRSSNAHAPPSYTYRQPASGAGTGGREGDTDVTITPSQGRTGPLDGGERGRSPPPPPPLSQPQYSTPRTSVKPGEAKSDSTEGVEIEGEKEGEFINTQYKPVQFHTTWKDGRRPKADRGGNVRGEGSDDEVRVPVYECVCL